MNEQKNITPKGKKVSKKYLTKDAVAMKREIDKHSKKPDSDASAYGKWPADYEKRDTDKGKPYKTQKSNATKAFKKMFGEVIEESEKGDKALRNKSKKTGISFSILKQVYNRGLAAWKTGHRPGASQHQWAMGRVNSFATGVGGARKADSDLWNKVKGGKKLKEEYSNLRNEVKKILNEIISEEYPESFSFEEFDNIKTYSGKLRYADERLKKLGSGSSRVVYKVDEEKVLKIAKNAKGLAQNSVEADGYLQSYEIIAKVFETDYNDFWIEMELAKKLTPSRFKQLTKIDIKELWSYLFYEKSNHKQNMGLNSERIQQIKENEFVQELMNVIMDYDMSYPGDFGRISSYGEVVRDGESRVVLVDFGLTKSVQYNYYSK